MYITKNEVNVHCVEPVDRIIDNGFAKNLNRPSIGKTPEGRSVTMPETPLQNNFSKKVRGQKHLWEVCNCRSICIIFYSVLIIS